jgi:hypothetical protein
MSRMMAGTDHGPELTLDRHDDYRTYNADPESLRAAAAELIGLRPDVIFAQPQNS